jgi:hypothetical protein
MMVGDRMDSERRKTWVERLAGRNKGQWRLDLSNIPSKQLPPAVTKEVYDGISLSCVPDEDLPGFYNLNFQIMLWGIYGNWGGLALINQYGDYDTVEFDQGEITDSAPSNVVVQSNLPNMSHAEKIKLSELTKSFDMILRLLDIGRLEETPNIPNR